MSMDGFYDRAHEYSVFIIEFIGTFFLILTIGLVSVIGGASLLDPVRPIDVIGPIAIGSVLMVCVFMGGHISGAHYNPAVTLAVWCSGRDKISTRTAVGYVIAQLLGSFAAALSSWAITGDTHGLYPKDSSHATEARALFIELLFTALLVSVVLNTATTKSQANNSFYGLAIGFTVVAGATCTGPVSGGVFNPAVGFGPILVNSMNNGFNRLSHIWIYWLGPPLGALLATFVFRITNHQHEYRAGGTELARSLSRSHQLLDPHNLQEDPEYNY